MNGAATLQLHGGEILRSWLMDADGGYVDEVQGIIWFVLLSAVVVGFPCPLGHQAQEE